MSLDLELLVERARPDFDFGAKALLVASQPFQLNPDPVPGSLELVVEQTGVAARVDIQNVHPAVAVKIRGSGGTCALVHREASCKHKPAVACILPECSAVLPESIQVQVPVVVVVNDATAETRIRPQQLWGARIRLKQPVSFVQQECAGSLQSRGKEIHRAVAIEVCYAQHSGCAGACGADSLRHIGEAIASLVGKDLRRRIQVGDHEVDVAVVIDVRGHHSDTGPLVASYSESIGNVGKGAIAVVAKHAVGGRGVVAYIEIQIAVMIVVHKCRGAPRRGAVADTGGFRDILKSGLPLIAKQRSRSSQIEIRHAVIVVVPDGDGRMPGGWNSARSGNVGESPFAVVGEDNRSETVRTGLGSRHNNIDIAVAVEVRERKAASRRKGKGIPGRRSERREARLGGYVFEWRQSVARSRGNRRWAAGRHEIRGKRVGAHFAVLVSDRHPAARFALLLDRAEALQQPVPLVRPAQLQEQGPEVIQGGGVQRFQLQAALQRRLGFVILAQPGFQHAQMVEACGIPGIDLRDARKMLDRLFAFALVLVQETQGVVRVRTIARLSESVLQGEQSLVVVLLV